jgi:hypothetical protein
VADMSGTLDMSEPLVRQSSCNGGSLVAATEGRHSRASPRTDVDDSSQEAQDQRAGPVLVHAHSLCTFRART